MGRPAHALLLALVAVLLMGAASTTAPMPPHALPIRHVFIIMLENEDADVTFGPKSPAPYLAQTLTAAGAYLPNYYGTGHFSLDNYISLISGQAPNPTTQFDCQTYAPFDMKGATADGQAIGAGCVYPASVRSLADELPAHGFTWRSYSEDMGNDPSRESGTCGHPPLGAPDNTQKAQAPSGVAPGGDQYATRHNPFMYFHSVIDSPSCDSNAVNFMRLPVDLMALATTPNLAFITPNLCDDGHDKPCVNGQPGGLITANAWLQQWVPMILASPAYKQDGLLLILFDEGELTSTLDPATGNRVLHGDATFCCGEQSGPNTKLAGLIGVGGGNTGAVVLSKYIRPGTVSRQAYNHYATLRTIEDIFGLAHLGYSGADGVVPFGSDVFNFVPFVFDVFTSTRP